jgi:transposase-like protein
MEVETYCPECCEVTTCTLIESIAEVSTYRCHECKEEFSD